VAKIIILCNIVID